jgi:hypothetical protein
MVLGRGVERWGDRVIIIKGGGERRRHRIPQAVLVNMRGRDDGGGGRSTMTTIAEGDVPHGQRLEGKLGRGTTTMMTTMTTTTAGKKVASS